MEDYCSVWEPELAKFMRLPHGVPSHDAFSALFRAPDPSALPRMARDWGDELGGVAAVEGKSNEIPALPKLLEMLERKGRVMTADALHAQRGTAAARRCDYARTLKSVRGHCTRMSADAARGRRAVLGRTDPAGGFPMASRG